MNEMYVLWIITGLALTMSFVVSRQKTFQALKIALKRLLSILPPFMVMMLLVSAVLYFVTDEMIAHYLGNENKYFAVLFASIIGSITFLPGFIAFPLAGLLLSRGVMYMVLAAFTTTLMMVGVVTYPVEKAYMGTRATIMRNSLSFLIALIISVAVGIMYGELP
jgi:uncharacterized membrane protein YraQ (UPF0718 family)